MGARGIKWVRATGRICQKKASNMRGICQNSFFLIKICQKF